MILRESVGSIELYNYIENNKNNLKLIDMKGIDSSTVSILLINTVLSKVRFLEIKFIGGSQVQLIEKVLKRPNLLQTELLGARLQADRKFYMFGTRSSYYDAIALAGGSAGFLTYSDDLSLCGPPGTLVTFDISDG